MNPFLEMFLAQFEAQVIAETELAWLMREVQLRQRPPKVMCHAAQRTAGLTSASFCACVMMPPSARGAVKIRCAH